MRGRLIYPFILEICQVDVAATAADPGYDGLFREPKLLSTSDRIGDVGRREKTAIKVPGQFYTQDDFLSLGMVSNGNLAEIDMRVVFHFRDLENMGLVEPDTGTATIRIGDRLNAVYHKKTGALVQTIPNPPGLFITHANPIFGLGSNRNLLAVHFKSRDTGKEP